MAQNGRGGKCSKRFKEDYGYYYIVTEKYNNKMEESNKKKLFIQLRKTDTQMSSS